MDIEDMIAELEEYYEAAGFTDVYKRELSDKSSDEIRALYERTFDDAFM